MSILPYMQDRRDTIEEFEEMDFGNLIAELIDGLMIIAQAYSSDQHDLVTAILGYHLRLALDALRNEEYRPMSISGVRIRGSDHGLPNDNALGADLAVRCLNVDGTRSPSATVKVLSNANSANEMVSSYLPSVSECRSRLVSVYPSRRVEYPFSSGQ
jgi:hypothetical protein